MIFRSRLLGIFPLLLFLCCALFTGSNLGYASTTVQARPETSPTIQSTTVPVFGLMVDAGGLGDRGFSDSIHAGLVRATQEYGARLELAQLPPEATSTESVVEQLKNLAAHGCLVVVCSGSGMRDALAQVAPLYPETYFILMDGEALAYPPNVASVSFATEQAAYLAGALAASMSRSRVLGCVGALDIPVINDFLLGFAAGARRAVPQVQIMTAYIQDHDKESVVWNNPQTARAMAEAMHKEQGADVFFPVAGASGLGVFDLIRDAGLFAVGVDSDQDHLVEGRILTSVIKHLDVAVLHMIRGVMAGTFRNADHHLTLAEGGVDISPMRFTREHTPPEVLELLQQLRQEILTGAVTVPHARHGGNAPTP